MSTEDHCLQLLNKKVNIRKKLQDMVGIEHKNSKHETNVLVPELYCSH